MARNSDDRAMHATSAGNVADHDLDRMLRMLVPPVPSDTLRARLRRDFAPAVPENEGGRAGGRPWRAFDGRVGGMAVAAALVLAVALGTLVPAAPEPPAVAAVQVDAAEALYAYDEDAVFDEDILAAELAEGAPDSAAFMVATFGAATRGTYTGSDVSYGLLTNVSYDAELAGLMPLE